MMNSTISNPDQEVKLYYSSKIEDIKREKIAFVIDMYEEIKNEDFLSVSGDKKESRFEVIMSEIENFVKVKDYFSVKTEFALYTYTRRLKQEIKFSLINAFLEKLNEFKFHCGKSNLSNGNEQLDLAEIYNEAYSYLKPFLSIESFSNSKNYENDCIIRFILFYNRSDIPAIVSNSSEYNVINFIRMTKFIFDVVFLRRKIANEEDKKILKTTFNSFCGNKPKYWYAFENSGNILKFKHYMNLLLANPNQRVKLSNLDKYQKKVDELIKNFSPDN